jgi:hypothetical protein
MSMKTLLGRQTTHESSDTRAALAKAVEAADAKVPQRQRAIDFLATDLEPGLNSLLEHRARILRGMANADRLDELARAELLPGAGPPQSSSLNADLPTVERAIQIRRRACELQRAIVVREHGQWSAIICQQLATIHRQQVHRIAVALEELSEALRDHNELVSGLRDGEVNFTSDLRPMLLPNMDLEDENSSASLWMRDARDNKLL